MQLRICITLVALAGIVLPTAGNGTPPTWEYETLRDIDWYVTAPGVVVLSTDRCLRGVSQADGTERWRFDVDDLDRHRFELIPYTHLALISFPRDPHDAHPIAALVDLSTGEHRWTTEQTGLSDTFGAFLIPPKDALLIYGKKSGQKHKVLMLVELETGTPIWSVDRPFDDWRPEIFGNGAQPPLFDSDESMLLFLNGKSIRKYSLTDGRLLWEAQDLQRAGGGLLDPGQTDADRSNPVAPTMYSGYAPMVLAYDGRRFFAPHHNTVGAFSTYNGARRWLKPAKLAGIPTQMERVPQGLLVRTIPEDPEEPSLHWISLLDIQTGHEIWRSPRREGSILKKIFGTWLGSTPFLVHDDRIVVAADGKLYTVTLDTGNEQKLCDLDFESTESAVSLEIRGDQYLVMGDQNALWCDFEGNVRKRIYYDPPDGFARGLAMLAIAAILDTQDDIRIGKVTISMQADYSAGFEELIREYTATAEGTHYMYILTESPDGNQIVRIGKDDSEEHGRIFVRTHEPDYSVCPYTSNLLWKSDERKISCYAF